MGLCPIVYDLSYHRNAGHPGGEAPQLFGTLACFCTGSLSAAPQVSVGGFN